ncbi:glycogen/starch synthase, partial [Nitratifractor sp.]
MKILFASAELFPFSKSGGLADMASALPRAMHKTGEEITLVTPLYSSVNIDKYYIRRSGVRFQLDFGGRAHKVEIHRCKYEGVEILFVYNKILCDREYLYGPPGGSYPDNDLRFA